MLFVQLFSDPPVASNLIRDRNLLGHKEPVWGAMLWFIYPNLLILFHALWTVGLGYPYNINFGKYINNNIA